MIQLYLNLANLPFSLAEKSAPVKNTEALQWQLTVKNVNGHLIGFAMDLKTAYWLCFPVPVDSTPGALQRVFLEQVAEQALRVCDLSAAESLQLGYWIAIALEPVELLLLEDKQLNNSLKRHAKFVVDLLCDDYPLPETNLEWFHLSLSFNRMSNAQQHSPLENFQSFWLGLLQFMQQRHPPVTSQPKQANLPSNVIPFPLRSPK